MSSRTELLIKAIKTYSGCGDWPDDVMTDIANLALQAAEEDSPILLAAAAINICDNYSAHGTVFYKTSQPDPFPYRMTLQRVAP